ncbi:MAG TPA: PAS domain S-box protein [Ignavibacteriaceae bacterium]|nr:PAS domain S-box protein [Ignavibacteriaceae bacterium]
MDDNKKTKEELIQEITELRSHLKEFEKSNEDRTKKEHQVFLQKTQFQHLFENIALGVALLDAHDYIIEVNKKFEKIFQYTEEEIKGAQINDIIVPAQFKEEGKNFSSTLSSGEVLIKETIRKRKDGTLINVRLHGVPTIIDGKKRGSYAIYEDISEYKIAETSLKNSKTQLYYALKIAKMGHWEYDVERNIFTLNDYFYSLLRTNAEKQGGYTMPASEYAKRFLHPDDKLVIESETEKAIETSDPNYSQQLEHRIIYGDGETGYLNVNIYIVKDEQGKTIKIFGINQDITDRKQTEENLHRERVLLRTLIDNIPDAIFAKDKEGRKIIANLADLQNMGLNSEEEAVGKTDFEFFPKEIAQGFYANDFSVIQTGKPLMNKEEFFTDSNNKVHWLLTSKLPFKDSKGNIVGLIGIARNITEKKLAEENLKKERILLRTLIDNIPDVIYVKDLDCRKTIANLADIHINGAQTEAEVVGKTDFDLFPKEIAEKFYADDMTVLTKGKPVINREEYFIDAQGNKQWLLTTKVPLLNDKGEIIGLAGIGRNITQQKEAEEALRETAKKLQLIFDNAFDGISIFEENTDNGKRKLIECNARFAELAGRTKEELLSYGYTCDWTTPLSEENKESIKQNVAFKGSFSWIRPDAKENIIEYAAVPIKMNGNIYSIQIDRDVTEQKRMEKAIQYEKTQLRTLIDSIPDLINFKNSEGKYILNNKAHLNSIGAKSQEDVLGKTTFDYHPKELAEKYHADEMKIIQTGESMIDKEEAAVDPETGEVRWSLTSKIPLWQDGEIKGIIGLSRDITNRKAAETALNESLEKFRSIFENAFDGISIFEENYEPGKRRLIECNERYAEMSGRSREELLRIANLEEAGLTKNLTDKNDKYINEGIRFQGFFTWMRPDGRDNVIEYAAAPIMTQGKKYTIGIDRDVTEKKRAEEALKEAYDELEHKNKELEKANKIKGQFLANMSHEIRTPLNAVIGMTGLLMGTSLTKEQQDFVETINGSGNILLTLINDILDFSKIEAQKIELEKQPFDVRLCVEEALDLVASRALDKNLELAYIMDERLSSKVIGDVTRLRQILVNLLSNAIKFTDQGEVVVSVNGQLKDNYAYQLHFSVRDTGLGIPFNKQDRIFQSFTQIDASTTRKFGGTGLGLAISKQLSELMGGTMWFESSGDPGKGTTFHFTILAELSVEKQVTRDISALLNKRILIVDDNKTNREILFKQAELLEMKPTCAESGPEALKILQEGAKFDLAVLDFHMPAMDGHMLAEKIRTIDPCKNLPLILLSSYGYREKKADFSVFAATLTKPIKLSHLHNALITVLSKNEGISKQVETTPLVFDSGIAEKHPLRILLAEDNIINQKVALRFLERIGYRADLAFNGIEVIEALKRQPYDVILMDIQMPDMDGLQATLEIRNQFPKDQQPRIIAMTANAMKDDHEKYLASGMEDYIIKPFKMEDLVRALLNSERLPNSTSKVYAGKDIDREE